jgi:hypothetical protein
MVDHGCIISHTNNSAGILDLDIFCQVINQPELT